MNIGISTQRKNLTLLWNRCLEGYDTEDMVVRDIDTDGNYCLFCAFNTSLEAEKFAETFLIYHLSKGMYAEKTTLAGKYFILVTYNTLKHE